MPIASPGLFSRALCSDRFRATSESRARTGSRYSQKQVASHFALLTTISISNLANCSHRIDMSEKRQTAPSDGRGSLRQPLRHLRKDLHPPMEVRLRLSGPSSSCSVLPKVPCLHSSEQHSQPLN